MMPEDRFSSDLTLQSHLWDRKEEIQLQRRENLAHGHAPYKGVHLTSRTQVEWILDEEGWTVEPDSPIETRANFEGVVLRDAQLSGISLCGANLTHADLSGAKFDQSKLDRIDCRAADLSNASFRSASMTHVRAEGARLLHTDLSKAQLIGADLSAISATGAVFAQSTITGTIFREASLSEADFSNTVQDLTPTVTPLDFTKATLTNARMQRGNFHRAIFTGANLAGADLSNAILTSCDLRHVRMDVATSLDHVVLDNRIRIADVIWNGVPLQQVSFNLVQTTGDQLEAKTGARSRRQRGDLYIAAARGYHALSLALRAQGIAEEASRFHLREMETRRKAFWYHHERGKWIYSWILRIVAGYGELPQLTAMVYISVLVVFASIYFIATNQSTRRQDRLQWYDALLLSITSFHGRGFFATPANLGDAVAIPAAIEAILGLFIEAIFIATFSRRFLE